MQRQLREFFGRKSTFLIYGPKDSPCSCDQLLVVGGHLRKTTEKCNKLHLFCDVINVTHPYESYIIIMSHTSLWVIHPYESYIMKALDLRFQDFGRLSVMVSYTALVMRVWHFRRSDLAAAYALAGVSDPTFWLFTPEKSTTVQAVFLINQFSLRF